MENLSRRDVLDMLNKQAPEDEAFVEEAMRVIDHWLDRGDGVAVYRNEDLGDHTWLGHMKFVSFGGPEAQLETGVGHNPPTRLPDIGNEINWRYQLVGTYLGTPLREVEDIVFPDFGEGALD